MLVILITNLKFSKNILDLNFTDLSLFFSFSNLLLFFVCVYFRCRESLFLQPRADCKAQKRKVDTNDSEQPQDSLVTNLRQESMRPVSINVSRQHLLNVQCRTETYRLENVMIAFIICSFYVIAKQESVSDVYQFRYDDFESKVNMGLLPSHLMEII